MNRLGTANRLALFLCALLLGIALSGSNASAHGWGHHHGLFGHGWHHGGWHHGFRQHAVGGPARLGPHCWVDTDNTRGFGYFKWCDNARPAHRGKHRHHHHR
jgi:hypothetical protein